MRHEQLRHRLLGAAALITCLSIGKHASAFCQTTTCLPQLNCTDDPEQCCILDRNGCDTNGLVITWASDCTSYSIQQNGSPVRGITAQQLSDTVDAGFGTWMQADCNLGTPSIRFENFGMAECSEVEVNSIDGGPNASIWMFRDEVWPHTDVDDAVGQVNASALALTTVTFNWMTGELLDADVEINSAQAAFTVDDDDVDIDLLAIVTHEAGHFLGLDHSNDTTATMAPGYVPHSTDQRTLSFDDEAGICQSYPKGRSTSSPSCDPRGTYSPECASQGGCAVAGPALLGRGGTSAGWLWPAFALLLGAFGLRKRRSLTASSR
jgi:hypothetical protein